MSERQELDDNIRLLNVEIDTKLTLMKQHNADLQKIIMGGGNNAQRRAIELNAKFEEAKAALESLTKNVNDIRLRVRVLNNSYNNLETIQEADEDNSVVIDVRAAASSAAVTSENYS